MPSAGKNSAVVPAVFHIPPYLNPFNRFPDFPHKQALKTWVDSMCASLWHKWNESQTGGSQQILRWIQSGILQSSHDYENEEKWEREKTNWLKTSTKEWMCARERAWTVMQWVWVQISREGCRFFCKQLQMFGDQGGKMTRTLGMFQLLTARPEQPRRASGDSFTAEVICAGYYKTGDLKYYSLALGWMLNVYWTQLEVWTQGNELKKIRGEGT